MYSFLLDISIAPLQVHYYSEGLPTQHGRRSFTPKRPRQIRVQDLPKVPACTRLERDSNPRPSCRLISTLPLSHHALHDIHSINQPLIYLTISSLMIQKI